MRLDYNTAQNWTMKTSVIDLISPGLTSMVRDDDHGSCYDME